MNKADLAQIIVDQASTSLPEHPVSRMEAAKLMPLLNNKQIIILSGIRRCGKSTLMQLIRRQLPNSDCYINFDDDRLVPFKLEDFQKLLEVFIELFGVQNNFYFDEIQNILGWERFVRRLHDEGKKVLVTGSNASLLSSELGTHLTGRHIAIELFPFSFREFMLSQNLELLEETRRTSTTIALLKKHFADFKRLGGFPEYLESRQKQYLHTLYENILYKDIIVRHKLPQEKQVKELIYYLASNNTRTFTYNSLKKLLGVASSNTIAEYCSYLENSFLCFTLNRFSYSLKKQIHFAKKIYFIDQAIAEVVGFRFSEDLGRTIENIVFLQLKRQGYEIYFHSENSECDFVLREGYNISAAIQVCVSLEDPQTKKREMKGLLEAMELYELDRGLIITEDETSEELITHKGKQYQVSIIPCWSWLLQSSV